MTQADAIEAAVDANIWTPFDAQRAGRSAELEPTDRWKVAPSDSCSCPVWCHCSCEPSVSELMSSPHHWYKASDRFEEPELCLPFAEVVQVARNCYISLPGGGHNLVLLYKSLKDWAKGHVKSVRKWLTRLLLLPFRIGELAEPCLGPALARTLIRVCWKNKMVQTSTGSALMQVPLMYKQAGPFNELDSKCIWLVHGSIKAEAAAEYCDVFASTTGAKKAKVAAATAAMEISLKCNYIDTYGFMEAVASDPEALRQFYTFAAFGSKPVLYGRISPFIPQYSALRPIMNKHVRSLLVSQQQMEAMFNLYRLVSSKTMGDDLKEDALKWKVNVWRRNKKR